MSYVVVILLCVNFLNPTVSDIVKKREDDDKCGDDFLLYFQKIEFLRDEIQLYFEDKLIDNKNYTLLKEVLENLPLVVNKTRETLEYFVVINKNISDTNQDIEEELIQLRHTLEGLGNDLETRTVDDALLEMYEAKLKKAKYVSNVKAKNNVWELQNLTQAIFDKINSLASFSTEIVGKMTNLPHQIASDIDLLDSSLEVTRSSCLINANIQLNNLFKEIIELLRLIELKLKYFEDGMRNLHTLVVKINELAEDLDDLIREIGAFPDESILSILAELKTKEKLKTLEDNFNLKLTELEPNEHWMELLLEQAAELNKLEKSKKLLSDLPDYSKVLNEYEKLFAGCKYKEPPEKLKTGL